MMSPIGTKKDAWLIGLVASLVVLVVLFTWFLGPHSLGDTPTYTQAMDVLGGATPPAGFMANRVITTFGALEIIRSAGPHLGGVFNVWFILNLIFFFAACLAFYRLCLEFFASEKAAFLSTLFLAGNYGFFIFSLNYSMDVGGWCFYILSLLFLSRHSRSGSKRDILLAGAMVGIGGLFKEYAFLGALAIAAYLIIEAWPELGQSAGWKKLASKTVPSALAACIPVILVYIWAYGRFHYTYVDWFGANVAYYIYRSRILEFIKSLGSLINLGVFPFLGGIYIVMREWRSMNRGMRLFLIATLISFLPIFWWPAITQRILAITIPFLVIVSGFLFKKCERRWYWFLPLLALYILATFFMDSYLLTAINLPF